MYCRALQYIGQPPSAAAGIKPGCGGTQAGPAAASKQLKVLPKTLQATLDFVPELSEEQAKVVSRARAGESLFITGAAGTGKSFLLQCVISELRELNADRLSRGWQSQHRPVSRL